MSYPGGKGGAGIWQTIVNQMPPHDTYIEAFLGSGAVLRHKRTANVNIAIELDPACRRVDDDQLAIIGTDREVNCQSERGSCSTSFHRSW